MPFPRAGPRVVVGIAAIVTIVCCTVQLLRRLPQPFFRPAEVLPPPPPPVPQGSSIRVLRRPGIPIHRGPAIGYNQGRRAVFGYLRNRAVAPNQPFVIPFHNGSHGLVPRAALALTDVVAELTRR